MKRVMIALIIGMVFLSACAASPDVQAPEPAEPAEPVAVPQPTELMAETDFSVTDALGREVEFSNPPTRIVITGKALFMIADVLYMFPDASEKVIATGNAGQGASNFISLVDPNYEAKVLLEQDAGAEQVAALLPDLVILKSYLAETVGKPIETINIPVVYVDLETPDQYIRDLAIIGKVFQNEPRAQQISTFFLDKTDLVRRAVQDVTQKPRVLMLYYSDKDGSVAFQVPPMTWIQTQMVEIAGGAPIWGDANPGNGWTTVSLEQIAAWDADQIYVISYFTDPTEVVARLKNDLQWQALRATRQDQLFAFPGDLYSWDQPDPRWILGLTWLAAHLYPERFPDYNSELDAQDFYQTLYGLDQAFFEEKIRPTFKGDLP
jgi:iron complex transport system substrate-binding protein